MKMIHNLKKKKKEEFVHWRDAPASRKPGHDFKIKLNLHFVVADLLLKISDYLLKWYLSHWMENQRGTFIMDMCKT